MSEALFRITALDSTLGRATFKSRAAPQDRYFHNQVSQDIKRRFTACFVAITQDHRIAGYCTLSSASVLLSELPAAHFYRHHGFKSLPNQALTLLLPLARLPER